MRISDWSSDVCSSDLLNGNAAAIDIGVDQPLAGPPRGIDDQRLAIDFDLTDLDAHLIISAIKPYRPAVADGQDTVQLPVNADRALGLGVRDQRRNRREILLQLIPCRRAFKAFWIFFGDEAGRDRSLPKARMLHDRRKEIDVVANAFQLVAVAGIDLFVDRKSTRLNSSH